MNQYDVIVIGAGPGGYVSAIRAAQLGLKAAIVEKQWMGGVCLNVGCIPSKALLKNAELAHTLRKEAKAFGFSFDNLELDYSVAVQRSRKVSSRLVNGIGFLMKKNNIDVYMGSAKLTSKDTLEVTAEDGTLTQLQARNVVIATGAHSIDIPAWGTDGEKVLSYVEAILQEKRPASAIIIGGGAIGVEFSTIWSGYGTEVTIVEMLPHILPAEDVETADVLAKEYKKRGIKILAGTKVESVEKTETGVKVTVSNEKGQQVLEAEQALVAIGFRPNSAGLGLEELGVKLDKRGFIEIDERMATSVPGIYAIGDVTGKMLLAHVASAMGMAASENIAGVETKKLDYRMMPRAVYADPQVASFGYTEEQAKEAGYELNIGRFNFMANGKALGLNAGTGFAKIIADANTGELLGAALVGPDVSELLPELTLAQASELTAEEIARTVHAHPTLSEVVMEAAHGVEGSPIHS
jgi:dihydrolipoamide dehydrogenase